MCITYTYIFGKDLKATYFDKYAKGRVHLLIKDQANYPTA